jgi:hypothetical protein
MPVEVTAERARVGPQRGVLVFTRPAAPAAAARVAAALGAQLAIGPLAARAAVTAAARARRAARARLIGERVLAAHAAAAVPPAVRAAPPEVVARAARTVLDTERAAADARAATGDPPAFDPLAAADARLAAAAARAGDTRAARTRNRTLGRDLAVANAVSLVLLVAGGLLLAQGRGPTSPLVAALVAASATTTAATLVRAGHRVRRHREAAARAGASLAAALARAGVASLAELDARAAAHERWQRRRHRADRLGREAGALRRRWHELVGEAQPDDVAGLLAAAAWWRAVSATAAEAHRLAGRPGRPIVAAVERDLVPELLRAGPGVPLVVVSPD